MKAWLYKKIGAFIKDAVYAANDGVVTTFAVVAGVVGASLDPLVILILGLANLFADGISMASGSYLGSKSESNLYALERAKNREILRNNRKEYKDRVAKFLTKKGSKDEGVESLAELITENEEFALDFVLHEEMGLAEQEKTKPLKGAMVTLFSFMFAGLIPLLPYIFFTQYGNTFMYAILFTASALFIVGASRAIFIKNSWFISGLEMLLIGGVAAAVAYMIGFVASGIVPSSLN